MAENEPVSSAVVIASISGSPGSEGNLSQPHLSVDPSTHNITAEGEIMNSKLCGICLRVFPMAIFSSMKASLHRRHQSKINALFKSAEASCLLCTLYSGYNFRPSFKRIHRCRPISRDTRMHCTRWQLYRNTRLLITLLRAVILPFLSTVSSLGRKEVSRKVTTKMNLENFLFYSARRLPLSGFQRLITTRNPAIQRQIGRSFSLTLSQTH
jgi:hypothetical protein